MRIVVISHKLSYARPFLTIRNTTQMPRESSGPRTDIRPEPPIPASGSAVSEMATASRSGQMGHATKEIGKTTELKALGNSHTSMGISTKVTG